jgi:hypothetical protein
MSFLIKIDGSVLVATLLNLADIDEIDEAGFLFLLWFILWHFLLLTHLITMHHRLSLLRFQI